MLSLRKICLILNYKLQVSTGIPFPTTRLHQFAFAARSRSRNVASNTTDRNCQKNSCLGTTSTQMVRTHTRCECRVAHDLGCAAYGPFAFESERLRKPMCFARSVFHRRRGHKFVLLLPEGKSNELDPDSVAIFFVAWVIEKSAGKYDAASRSTSFASCVGQLATDLIQPHKAKETFD